MSVAWRAALAVALLSSWLVLLLAGWALGGGVHILFLGGLLAFPWSVFRDPEPPSGE